MHMITRPSITRLCFCNLPSTVMTRTQAASDATSTVITPAAGGWLSLRTRLHKHLHSPWCSSRKQQLPCALCIMPPAPHASLLLGVQAAAAHHRCPCRGSHHTRYNSPGVAAQRQQLSTTPGSPTTGAQNARHRSRQSVLTLPLTTAATHPCGSCWGSHHSGSASPP
jgi:hypothetical protein